MRNNLFINSDSLKELIDQMYDEVIIYDNNYRVVYVNSACRRHYSVTEEEMIGKNFYDFIDKKWWDISILPIVYKEKKSFAIKQTTYVGVELLTIAVPIFDENKEIKYVVMNVRDTAKEVELYNPKYISRLSSINPNSDFIACSECMKKILKLINRIKDVDSTVIITGESGTGKTMLARYIHSVSNRKNKPFISINCAAIPTSLIESELFGYVKGAFTGASAEGKEGLLLAANNGVLLLDEISELNLRAQAKLLTVLQEGEFIPVGGTKTIKVNVKIIATTNKNLKELVNLKRFRSDLYYRLYIVELFIPPLRTRREAIIPLAQKFLKYFCAKYNVERHFSAGVISVFLDSNWEGNIRELKHLVERLVVTSNSLVIDLDDLPNNLFNINYNVDNKLVSFEDYNFKDKISEYERILVAKAYKEYPTSRKLAQYFKISQTKANNLINKYIK